MYNFNNRYIISNDRIIDKKNQNCFKINKSVYNELSRFNLTRDVREINEYTLKYLIDRQIIIESNFEYNPFIHVSNKYNNKRLFIQLTNRCNLFCKHCYIESGAKYEDYFDLKKVKKLINKATALGIYRIDFTGGEIFTQDYMMKLLEYLEEKPVSYNLFSNLTLISEIDIKKIIKLNGLNSIITSVDYFNSKQHDDFRGMEGAYSKTLKNVIDLASKNVSITVNTMVLDDNHEDIFEMIDFFLSQNIKIHFDTIIDCGRAKGNINNDMQKKFENLDFIKEIGKKIKDKYKTDIGTDEISCGIGETLIYIDYKGNFEFCPGLTSEISREYYMGDSIEEATNKISNIDIKCNNKECDLIEDCSYGCRLRALTDFKNVKAPDQMMCRFKGVSLDKYDKNINMGKKNNMVKLKNVLYCRNSRQDALFMLLLNSQRMFELNIEYEKSLDKLSKGCNIQDIDSGLIKFLKEGENIESI